MELRTLRSFAAGLEYYLDEFTSFIGVLGLLFGLLMRRFAIEHNGAIKSHLGFDLRA